MTLWFSHLVYTICCYLCIVCLLSPDSTMSETGALSLGCWLLISKTNFQTTPLSLHLLVICRCSIRLLLTKFIPFTANSFWSTRVVDIISEVLLGRGGRQKCQPGSHLVMFAWSKEDIKWCNYDHCCWLFVMVWVCVKGERVRRGPCVSHVCISNCWLEVVWWWALQTGMWSFHKLHKQVAVCVCVCFEAKPGTELRHALISTSPLGVQGSFWRGWGI